MYLLFSKLTSRVYFCANIFEFYPYPLQGQVTLTLKCACITIVWYRSVMSDRITQCKCYNLWDDQVCFVYVNLNYLYCCCFLINLLFCIKNCFFTFWMLNTMGVR